MVPLPRIRGLYEFGTNTENTEIYFWLRGSKLRNFFGKHYFTHTLEKNHNSDNFPGKGCDSIRTKDTIQICFHPIRTSVWT